MLSVIHKSLYADIIVIKLIIQYIIHTSLTLNSSDIIIFIIYQIGAIINEKK